MKHDTTILEIINSLIVFNLSDEQLNRIIEIINE